MSTPPPCAADSYKNYSYNRNRSRLVRTAATPPDRDPRTDAFSASTPEEWSNQTASWSSSIDRSLDDPLDWSSVNYETDFGASWWNAARRAKVGSIIESAVKDRQTELNGATITPALVVEALMARGAMQADVRAALRQRAGRVGENWLAYAAAEDRALLKLRDALARGEDIKSNALKLPIHKSFKDWTKTDRERFIKVAFASLFGGAALFVSGGAAAPALVAALGALGLGAEAFAAFGGLEIMLGVTGAALAGSKMANRTSNELENFDLIPLRGAHTSYAMHIFVPGFLRDDKDLLHAWGAIDNQYVSVIPEDGDLGLEFKRAPDGRVIVETSEDSLAKLHGVVSGSTLVSYRSLRGKSRSSTIVADLKDTATIERLSSLPRPLEIRLQLADHDEEFEAAMKQLAEKVKTNVEHIDVETDADAMVRPQRREWGHLTGEQLVLNWEPSTLSSLGACMTSFNESCTVNFYLTPTVLTKTALAGVAEAVSWPATLLSAAGFIDDPWALVKLRGKIAGEQLADALLAGKHGRRPVTFVGYSAGAYVVQSCLLKLHAAGERGRNIVDRVVFISAPISTSNKVWGPMRDVVSGRLVNVHCHLDWILLLMYKFNMLDPMTRLAGLSDVKRDDVENFNIKFRHAHLPDEISRILSEINLQE